MLKNGDKMVSIELRNDRLYLEDDKGCKITSKANVALSLSDKWDWTAYFLSGPVEQSIIDYLNDGAVNTSQYSFTAKLPWVEKEIKEQEKAQYLQQVDRKFKSSFDELKRKSKQQIPMLSNKKYKMQTPQFNLNKPLNTPVKSLSDFKTGMMGTTVDSPLRTPVKINKPYTPISLSKFNHTTPTPMPKLSVINDASTVASDESDFAFDTSAMIIPMAKKQPFQELAMQCPPSPDLEIPLSSRISFATSEAPSFVRVEDLKNSSLRVDEKQNLSAAAVTLDPISTIAAQPLVVASLDVKMTNDSLNDIAAGQDAIIASVVENPFPNMPAENQVQEAPISLKCAVANLINDIGGPTASSLPCSLSIVEDSLASQEIQLKLSAVFDSSAYSSDEECSPKLNCPCLKEMVFIV